MKLQKSRLFFDGVNAISVSKTSFLTLYSVNNTAFNLFIKIRTDQRD